MFSRDIRYIYDRTSVESHALIGNANRVMLILQNMMRLNKWDQYSITMEPYPGALIKCSQRFGKGTIEIVTGITGDMQDDQLRHCLCNCNFTVGWILRLQSETVQGDAQMYTVMACQGARKYTMVENVLASDFTEYTVGFPVVLIPYNSMAFLCCAGGGGVPTGCSKVDSQYGLDSDLWRASLRIIPWCAIGLPKWLPGAR